MCLTPAVSSTACPRKFQCKNQRCISTGLKCDGWNDCGDMSDELNCSTLLWTQNFLFVLYFISIICLNFQNLQHLQLYECFCYLGLFLTHFLTSCFPPECNASDITCRNGICKPMFWKCDGINDCGDGTDELNCGKSVASVFIQTLKGFFYQVFPHTSVFPLRF